MPAWTDYTSKTTPADTDEVMIKDFSDSNKANKRMLFSGLWNWIVNKLTNAVIANLETSPQTIVGAINSLNSNIINKGTYNADLNDIPVMVNRISVYRTGVDCTNSPVQNSYGVIKTSYIDSNNYAIQEFVSLSTGYYYIRLKVSGTWSKWYTHAHTGVLSDLTTTAKDSIVSAVNEIADKFCITRYNVLDLNEIDENCIFSTYGGANGPGDYTNWYMGVNIVLYTDTDAVNTGYKVQILIHIESGKMYVRGKYNNIWNEWKTIS